MRYHDGGLTAEAQARREDGRLQAASLFEQGMAATLRPRCARSSAWSW